MFETTLYAGWGDMDFNGHMRNEFFKADGRLAARVTSLGGWLDHAERKLVTPPLTLLEAMRAMGRTEDFQALTPLS